MENKINDELNQIKAALIIHLLIQVFLYHLKFYLKIKFDLIKEFYRIHSQRNSFKYFPENFPNFNQFFRNWIFIFNV